MANEGKHNIMVKSYEEKIEKAQNRIRELEREAEYKPQYEEAQGKMYELEFQIRQQEDKLRREQQQKMMELQKQQDYNAREAEYQNQLYANNEMLRKYEADINELKYLNRDAGYNQQIQNRGKARISH